MPIYNKITNPPETYTDGYGVEREVYEPAYITVGRKIVNTLGDFFNGKDRNLSDEEYYTKYGFGKPVGGMGYLVGDVAPAGLLKLGSELKAVEEAKAAARTKQAARNKAIIEGADEVKINPKTGRARLVKRNTEGSGVYEKVDYVPRERVSPVVKEISETEKKINDLNRAIAFNRSEYQRLLKQGNRERDVRNLEREYQSLKSQLERLSPPDYRFKDGGKLKRKC